MRTSLPNITRPGSIFRSASLRSCAAIALAAAAACAVPATAQNIAGRDSAPASQIPDTSQTMRAVQFSEFGGPDVLRVVETLRPAPGKGELLVRVRAAGVNPVDWKVRDGSIAAFAAKRPYTPGYDVSGVVEAVGEGVTKFKPGDQVFAMLALPKGGGYAQFALVPENDAARKPDAVDHNSAAATPLAALTAWQAIVDVAKVQEGQTVLIHGGAGGVGHFAVQIAKARGARVIATCSTRNVEFVKSLGADTVIDYKTQKFDELVKDVDMVLDPVGGDTRDRSLAVMKPGGTLVSIVGAPDSAKCAAAGVRCTAMLVKPSGTQLAEIAALIQSGAIRPEVGATFAMSDAAKAHELSASGSTPRGKIVLEIK